MRFPRHRAAASLKPLERRGRAHRGVCFPRHRAAASLKPAAVDHVDEPQRVFSAASGRGLIEATWRPAGGSAPPPTFSAASGRGLIEAPRPASTRGRRSRRFPRHRAAASLKLLGGPALRPADDPFSAASGRGLIEAPCRWRSRAGAGTFSAASGRGLIEAGLEKSMFRVSLSFPRHRAAASLKRQPPATVSTPPRVFRGIGPRPH